MKTLSVRRKIIVSVLTMMVLIYGTQGNLSYGQATASTVQLLPVSVSSPTVGEKLTLSLNIVGGTSVAGYEAAIEFDTSALRHVESVIGDYLPTGAFFVPPVVAGNLVKLAATSLMGESNGNGTLATITFEVRAVKASTLTLSNVLLSDSEGVTSRPQVEGAQIMNLSIAPQLPPVASSWNVQGSIYWVDYSAETIKRADLDGSNIETIVTISDEPHSIALDLVNGKMYWTDEGWDHVRRADLDGSNIETVVSGQDDPYGIALDMIGGKVYWTDEEWDIIRRADLDGSNVETIVPRLEDPYGIALDVNRGKMYWTDADTNKVQRADLDGSNIETLITRVDGRGIALDLGSGKMYWTNVWENKVQRANLDGSNIEDLVTEGLDVPIGIALDLVNGKMYWTDVGTDKIQRANLDGSNIEDLITEGLRTPTGIALSITPRITRTSVKEDVNLDGIVDINDLLDIAKRYGETTDKGRADVNADGVINIDDLILVAAVIDKAAAAPVLFSQRPKWLTLSLVNQWFTQAKLTGKRTPAYQRGILLLEQLLITLTPKKTALLANYPNPFNPETWIPYHLAKDADVTLHIYAVNGTLVRTLTLGHQPAGMYQNRSRAAYWDGKNAFGEPVASGVYFYTLSTESTRDSVTAGEFSATRRMLIRK